MRVVSCLFPFSSHAQFLHFLFLTRLFPILTVYWFNQTTIGNHSFKKTFQSLSILKCVGFFICRCSHPVVCCWLINKTWVLLRKINTCTCHLSRKCRHHLGRKKSVNIAKYKTEMIAELTRFHCLPSTKSVELRQNNSSVSEIQIIYN